MQRRPSYRYFVTGTDTGVGKTFVAAALARLAVAAGRRVLAWKPIETGVTEELGEDQRALVQAAGGWQTGEARGLYRYVMPAAPLVAGRAEGGPVKIHNVERVFRALATEVEVALVEGAGGLRVPIQETEGGVVDMAQLAALLQLPLIIVGRAGLGTINHSLLTIEAAERDGLRVAALVLSRRPDEDRDFAASNADEIRRRWTGNVIVFDGAAEQLDSLLR